MMIAIGLWLRGPTARARVFMLLGLLELTEQEADAVFAYGLTQGIFVEDAERVRTELQW